YEVYKWLLFEANALIAQQALGRMMEALEILPLLAGVVEKAKGSARERAEDRPNRQERLTPHTLVLDAGPLIALFHAADPDHESAVRGSVPWPGSIAA
ncbi:hypothetical protein, partial [Streptococcus pneumoniae]|uniref:hypothetical protein n=1 Tax=Streptococcus pneumoniae TaxID=1313 RepID=UPI001CB76D1D